MERHRICRICKRGVLDIHDPKHTRVFCETCYQYVSEPHQQHVPRRAKCKDDGIYCVSCKKCSPAGTEKCTSCNNVTTGITCGNGNIYEPTYVCNYSDSEQIPADLIDRNDTVNVPLTIYAGHKSNIFRKEIKIKQSSNTT